MNQLISVPKLNKVLDFLATNPFVRPVVSDTDLLRELKRTGFKIEADELRYILDKLVAANCVKREGKTVYHKAVAVFTMYYSIKTEGLIFNKNGGFSENETGFQFQPDSNQHAQNVMIQNDKTVAVAASNGSLILEKAAWVVAILGTLFLVGQCFKIWPFDN